MLTRQGVRDLNGPDMNGRGHNGHRAVTCPHYKNPHYPTTRVKRRLGEDERGLCDDEFADAVTIDVYVCTGCGEERFTGAER